MADTTLGLNLYRSPDPAEQAEPAWRDELLVAALQSGDELAYESLIERFSPPVYNIIYRLLTDPGESSDVVQDVFIKIFRNINKFRGDCSLKTWVYRIAVNEAYNHRRWFSRHRKNEIGLDGEEEDNQSYASQLADPGFSPFDVTLGHEHRQRIEAALDQLKPIFKTAVVLRDIEDLSYEEIAGIMQVSLGTVKTRILRGRDQLKRILIEQESAAGSNAKYPAVQAIG